MDQSKTATIGTISRMLTQPLEQADARAAPLQRRRQLGEEGQGVEVRLLHLQAKERTKESIRPWAWVEEARWG